MFSFSSVGCVNRDEFFLFPHIIFILPIFTLYVIGILAAPKTLCFFFYFFFFLFQNNKLSSLLVRVLVFFIFSFSYYFRCPNGNKKAKKIFFIFVFGEKCWILSKLGHFWLGVFFFHWKVLHFYKRKFPGKCYPKNGELNDIIMK